VTASRFAVTTSIGSSNRVWSGNETVREDSDEKTFFCLWSKRETHRRAKTSTAIFEEVKEQRMQTMVAIVMRVG
jgi:hypothetical protein